MNKQLATALKEMKDWEFDLLEHHLHIARLVRKIMIRYAIDEKAMAEVLHVQPKRMKEVLVGAYPFDLRLLSRLDAYGQQLAANDAKLKVEAESIQFNQYKDQYPMYVDRINKLLTILESKEPKP